MKKAESDFVKNIAVGDKVSSVFVVAKKEYKAKKNGEPYVALTLSDKTGAINSVLWDNVSPAREVLDQSDIVWVEGDVGNYNGPQLTLRNIKMINDDEYSISDLLRSVEDIGKIETSMMSLLEKTQNPWIKKFIRSIQDNKEFMGNFKKAPGGGKWHHSYFGGLFEHTYEVMQLCDTTCDLHSEVDRDLCLAGAFIHDCGKVFELSYDITFDYTDKGRLVGHIIQGNDYIMGHIQAIDGFPEDIAVNLQHIILSHQGEYVQRSPVLPQTLEACVVYHCDNLDSQVNAYKNVICGPREEGQKWSKWLTIINRQLFLKNETNDS